MQISRLYNTVKHLRPIQIRTRLKYTFLRKLIESGFYNKKYNQDITRKCVELKFDFKFSPNKTFNTKKILQNKFEFLNEEKTFKQTIDWNRPDLNKGTRLWKIKLHCGEYLIHLAKSYRSDQNQEVLNFIKENILSWINQNPLGNEGFAKDSWNSYVISLRLINWIKVYMLLSPIEDQSFKDSIEKSIKNQAKFLTDFLELDLQGNHLLEDAFGLLWASMFLDDQNMFDAAEKLLKKQLEEQILTDGAHYELSPMYHAILLVRLLDLINLLNSNQKGQTSMKFFSRKATEMLSWYNNIVGSYSEIPLLNDSALNNSPSKKNINEYSHALGIDSVDLSLSDSGYRVIEKDTYSLIIDVGNIGPDHIPGHAHADTFNFILSSDGKPIIVDTGTSTYNPGNIRDFERSTSAHNTVVVNGLNSSEVWSSFRVANRAKIIKLEEKENCIKAQHDGYKSIGVIHERSFIFSETGITINDLLLSSKLYTSKAYIHLHPSVDASLKNNLLSLNEFIISFEGFDKLELVEYFYAPEFNKRIKSKKLIISFKEKLVTKIKLAA